MSLVTQGIMFVSEEKIFSVYHLEPLQVVGIEGIWGILLCLLFIPIFNLIRIDDNSSMGVLFENHRYIERIDVYYQQIAHSSKFLDLTKDFKGILS